MDSNDFFSAINAMADLADQPMLTDASLGPSEHNAKAKILRHGLSVSAFASLEKHLGNLFEDFMSSLVLIRVPFRDLPDDFREFSTIDSLIGLQTRLGFLDKQYRLAAAETEMRRLTGFLNNPVQLNSFGFSPRGSNVADSDVRTALKALGVYKPWDRLTSLTHAIGAARVSLQSDFRNLAKTRHRSAHNPLSNIPTQDLKDNIESARVIAIVVAATLRYLKSAYSKARSANQLANLTKTPSPSFRFIDMQADGTWLEKKSISGVGVKKYTTIAAAKAGANARRDGRCVIVRAIARTPIEIA